MPVYGLMIAFHTFVFLHLADGPLWKKIAIQESDYCQNSWWSNLLFINNYIHADRPVRNTFSLALFKKPFEVLTIFSVLFNLGIWRVTCNSSSPVSYLCISCGSTKSMEST